jgi:hypothetical protein
MELIARPVDMLGINFYNRQMVIPVASCDVRRENTAMDGRCIRPHWVTCCVACMRAWPPVTSVTVVRRCPTPM